MQDNSTTETGMYNLGGDTSPPNASVTRQLNFAAGESGVAVTSENEWYKAAYYDGSGGYFDYPTQSNTVPTAVAPGSAVGSNNANFDSAVGSTTDVGAYANSASHYGTFDQGGNVFELTDTITVASLRAQRGGSYLSTGTPSALRASSTSFYPVTTGASSTRGFRISSSAPIPEPSAYAAILGALGLGLALTRRRARD
jgi:formylglycine-generating enzyme required for sulfatase activity